MKLSKLKIIFINRLIKENRAVENITTFDYIDKILIVLSTASSGVSIILFTRIVGTPVGIASASLTFFFSNNRNSQKITEYNKKQKEKA